MLIALIIAFVAGWVANSATRPDLSHIPGVEFKIKKAETTKLFKNGRKNVKQVIRATNESIGASGELVLKGAVYPKDLTTKK